MVRTTHPLFGSSQWDKTVFEDSDLSSLGMVSWVHGSRRCAVFACMGSNPDAVPMPTFQLCP